MAVVVVLGAVGLVGGITGNKPPLVRGTLRFEGGIQVPGPQKPNWQAGVQLTFVSKRDTSKSEAVTDALGRFSLRLKPGQYKVVIEGPGAKAFDNDRPMQPQNDFTFVNGVEIKPQPGGIITVTAGGPNRFPLVVVGR